jgi:glycosyltransferase involved in cell wall biosynthesis
MKENDTFSASPKRCGVIIPVYNSDIYVKELLNQIRGIQEKLSSDNLSVAIVDDGSNPPIEKHNISGLPVEWIRHSQNQGKGAALKTGFSYFLKKDADFIITMDGDLQHPPEFIPEFLRKYETDNFDVIVGSRKRNPKIMPFHRILSNTLTSLIISALIRQWVPDSQCGYRLYSREVIDSIQPRENRFHLESEMLIRCGWKNYGIGYISIPTIYNHEPSAIKNFSDTMNFITLIFRLAKERMIDNV